MIELINSYRNGNATVSIYSDGTREIEFPDEEGLILDFPLNIDIRLMTKCDFGYNPTTGKSVCTFCHESARTDGVEGDYDALLEVLVEADLPRGMELAIGVNEITPELKRFLQSCQSYGWIINGTINQGALAKRGAQEELKFFIENKLLTGIGISYRPKMPAMPKWLLDYENTVVHVIAGIDNFKDIVELSTQGVNKILILGEKDFGFNLGKVNLNSKSHKVWKSNVGLLPHLFQVVSFDNLSLSQLNVKELLSEEDWNEFYQGEHSFYINAVDKYFAPSSRSKIMNIPYGEMTLRQYFKHLENQLIDVRN